MENRAHNVLAAPNRCRIDARVLEVIQDQQYPDKWHLELEILKSQVVFGPNFAHPGRRMKGFWFGDRWLGDPPLTIQAEAEYHGGPQAGLLQLHEARLLNEAAS